LLFGAAKASFDIDESRDKTLISGVKPWYYNQHGLTNLPAAFKGRCKVFLVIL